MSRTAKIIIWIIVIGIIAYAIYRFIQKRKQIKTVIDIAKDIDTDTPGGGYTDIPV